MSSLVSHHLLILFPLFKFRVCCWVCVCVIEMSLSTCDSGETPVKKWELKPEDASCPTQNTRGHPSQQLTSASPPATSLWIALLLEFSTVAFSFLVLLTWQSFQISGSVSPLFWISCTKALRVSRELGLMNGSLLSCTNPSLVLRHRLLRPRRKSHYDQIYVQICERKFIS